jgi:hypothetical protein
MPRLASRRTPTVAEVIERPATEQSRIFTKQAPAPDLVAQRDEIDLDVHSPGERGDDVNVAQLVIGVVRR